MTAGAEGEPEMITGRAAFGLEVAIVGGIISVGDVVIMTETRFAAKLCTTEAKDVTVTMLGSGLDAGVVICCGNVSWGGAGGMGSPKFVAEVWMTGATLAALKLTVKSTKDIDLVISPAFVVVSDDGVGITGANPGRVVPI